MSASIRVLEFEHIKVINYRPQESNKRPPLVFVHGMGNTTKCWEYNFLPYFSEQGFDCYALDLSNHGRSGSKKKLRWTSIKNYSEDVNLVVQNLEHKPILIGHSMGGLIVQKYVQKYPDTIEKFVLLTSAYNRGVWMTVFRTLFCDPFTIFKVLLTLDLYPIYSKPEKARKWFFSEEFPEKDLVEITETLEHESFKVFLDFLLMRPIKRKHITPPVLVLGAEHDAFFHPKSYIRSFSKRYNVNVEIFKNKYHHIMMEEGWNLVAKRIEEWIVK